MNILVTGGSGFIGKSLIPKLLKEKHNISLLTRNVEKARKIYGDKITYIKGDICEKESLNNCCKNIEIVIHLVAKVGNELPNEKTIKEFNDVNVEGTKNIVLEAKKYNIKRFIYISSIAAMGVVNDCPISENSKENPILPYQTSKYKAERYLLKEYSENGFPVIILRPTKVYGKVKNSEVYLPQIKLCKKGINFIIGKNENYISNIYIEDFTDGLVNCIHHGKFGEIYILSGPDSLSAKKFGEIISKKLDRKVINVRISKNLMKFLAFLEERLLLLLKKKPFITEKNVEAICCDRIYDLSKAKKELCYNPKMTMENGLLEMLEFYKNENVI